MADRAQRNSYLGLSGYYQGGINDTDEPADEGVHRRRYVRRGEEPPCSLGAASSPNFYIFTNLKAL